MRQLKEQKALINTMKADEPINVYRIGDTQKDKMDLRPFNTRKKYITIKRICTKPEIEMLQIISAGLTKEYEKAKSVPSPKQFIKAHRPDISSMEDYIRIFGIDAVVDAIKRYKSMKSHGKDEGYLADLLKE